MINEPFEQEQLPPEQNSARTKRINRGVTAAVVAIIVVLIAALIVLFFIVTPYVVSGRSMTPTLQDGDHIMVLKVGFELERGDIILFERPGGEAPPVKRVIAMGGDTVRFDGAQWYVNGEALNEPYLAEQTYGEDYLSLFSELSATELEEGLTLESDELFVLGDNRNNSFDSHDYGPVKQDWVLGKVVGVY